MDELKLRQLILASAAALVKLRAAKLPRNALNKAEAQVWRGFRSACRERFPAISEMELDLAWSECRAHAASPLPLPREVF